MRFINKGKQVQVQIAMEFVGSSSPPIMLADFNVEKEMFEEFLDHVISECKKAYKRDELFPPITREEFRELTKDEFPPSPPPPPPGGFPL